MLRSRILLYQVIQNLLGMLQQVSQADLLLLRNRIAGKHLFPVCLIHRREKQIHGSQKLLRDFSLLRRLPHHNADPVIVQAFLSVSGEKQLLSADQFQTTLRKLLLLTAFFPGRHSFPFRNADRILHTLKTLLDQVVKEMPI